MLGGRAAVAKAPEPWAASSRGGNSQPSQHDPELNRTHIGGRCRTSCGFRGGVSHRGSGRRCLRLALPLAAARGRGAFDRAVLTAGTPGVCHKGQNSMQQLWTVLQHVGPNHLGHVCGQQAWMARAGTRCRRCPCPSGAVSRGHRRPVIAVPIPACVSMCLCVRVLCAVLCCAGVRLCVCCVCAVCVSVRVCVCVALCLVCVCALHTDATRGSLVWRGSTTSWPRAASTASEPSTPPVRNQRDASTPRDPHLHGHLFGCAPTVSLIASEPSIPPVRGLLYLPLPRLCPSHGEGRRRAGAGGGPLMLLAPKNAGPPPPRWLPLVFFALEPEFEPCTHSRLLPAVLPRQERHTATRQSRSRSRHLTHVRQVMRPGYYPLEFRWFDVGQQRPNSDHELMRCRDKWSSEHDPEVRFHLPATLATHRLAHCLCLACALRVCVAQCTMHSALRVSREGESTGNAQALATHRPAHCEGAGRTAGQHTSTG